MEFPKLKNSIDVFKTAHHDMQVRLDEILSAFQQISDLVANTWKVYNLMPLKGKIEGIAYCIDEGGIDFGSDNYTPTRKDLESLEAVICEYLDSRAIHFAEMY